MEGGLSSLGHLDLGGVQFDLGKGMADVVGKFSEAANGGGDVIEEAADKIGKAIGIDSGKTDEKTDKKTDKDG
jgi:hypothetical protein